MRLTKVSCQSKYTELLFFLKALKTQYRFLPKLHFCYFPFFWMHVLAFVFRYKAKQILFCKKYQLAGTCSGFNQLYNILNVFVSVIFDPGVENRYYLACSSSSTLLHNLFDSLYNTRQQEIMLPTYQGLFFPCCEKFNQPEESKCLLLWLFLSMCWPCGENDCRPLRLFRCVQTYMGSMNKTWHWSNWVRWCICNLQFLRSYSWFMCSKKAFYLFEMTMDVFFMGCLLYLMDSEQRGCNPKIIFCVLENIYFWCLFF